MHKGQRINDTHIVKDVYELAPKVVETLDQLQNEVNIANTALQVAQLNFEKAKAIADHTKDKLAKGVNLILLSGRDVDFSQDNKEIAFYHPKEKKIIVGKEIEPASKS